LTRRNPLLSCRLSAATGTLIRFVDEVPILVKNRLCNQESLEIIALPELDSNPPDEATPRFVSQLQMAMSSDESYLEDRASLEKDPETTEQDLLDLERRLRDRLREKLGLLPRPNDKKDRKSIIEHAKLNEVNPNFDLPALDELDDELPEKFLDDTLQTLLLPEQLEKKVAVLVDRAKTWADESGLTVMHLAFGFLEWSERDQSSTSFAPLLLLPAELERRRTPRGYRFFLKTTADELETNEVLRVKLKELDIELPSFNDYQDLDGFLDRCNSIKLPSARWRIHKQMALGIFPSARMAMYSNLAQPVVANSLVTELLGTTGVGSATPFESDYDNDDPEVEDKVPILVTDADAAQFSALVVKPH